MENILWKRGIVVGIILLFVGASVVPSIVGYNKDVEKTGSVQNEDRVIDNTEFDMLPTLDDPTWQWAVSAGGTSDDCGWGICVDSSGNTYITGSFWGSVLFGSTTLTSNGVEDVFVAKLDTNGNWQWAVNAGGTSIDIGFSICVDSSRNTYITGEFSDSALFGSTTLTSNGGYYDVFVAKLDSNGNWQWAVNAGGTNSDIGWGICVDSSGNTYITGEFSDSALFGSTTLISNGGYAVFVAKLDTNGNWQWAVSAGGTIYDRGCGICVDSSGNTYITGEFYDSALFGSTTLISNGEMDVFVAKLDSNGNWQWAVSAGGTSNDYGNGICVDSSRNTYITGEFHDSALFGSTTLISNGSYDVFVAKLDTNGNWQWAVSAGGTSSDYGWGICVDSSGNTYITGRFSGSALFGSTTLNSSGEMDVFVAKLDTNGNWQWAVSAGGTSIDIGFSICVDSSRNTYITGRFSDSALFGSTTLTSNGGDDVFVAKFTGGNQPPYAPSNPDPYDGETGVDIDHDLSWTGGDPDSGDIVTYDVYFGTTSPPLQVVSNQSHSTYDPGGLEYVTQYYWRIVSWDHGASNESIIWNFTTMDIPPEITDVTLTTSDPFDTIIGWENFSCTATDIDGVDEVKLVLTGDITTEYPLTKNGDDYYCNITISTADEYTWHIWADDTSDNYNTSAPQPFDLPMNEDVDMNGTVHFMDLWAVAMRYYECGPGYPAPSSYGWIREDVDNSGRVHILDLIAICWCYGESWGDCEPEPPEESNDISVLPSSQTVGINETFNVSIYVEPSELIIGVNIDYLYFNETLIHANSVTQSGLFYPHTTFFNPGTIDNVNGEIRDVYELIIGPGNVTDPGVFVNISFTAQEVSGTSELDLSGTITADETGAEVPRVNNGSVTVIGSDAIPPEITDVTITTSDPLDTDIGWENFTCNVTDDSEVYMVQLNITYPNSSSYTFPMTKNGDTYYHNTSLTAPGGENTPGYNYHIYATDTFGRMNTSTTQLFKLPMNADVDESGVVGFVDIMMVAGMWNAGGPNGWHRADVDNSGVVGFVDIMMVAGMWNEQW